MLSQSSAPVTADPLDYLWHSASGEMAFWLNGHDGPVGWVRAPHRGVQHLDKIQFSKKQHRFVFAEKFEVRYNQAFEQVVRACADLHREGKTFVTEPMVQALLALHKMGFAHSFESYCDGQLAGGGFGIQLGSVISADSLFYRVSNGSKAAFGRFLLHVRERHFSLVDVNVVGDHTVNFGEEWMPQWQFEQHLRNHLKDTPSISDDRPAPPLPWQIKYALPVARLWRNFRRRILPGSPLSPVPRGEGKGEGPTGVDA